MKKFNVLVFDFNKRNVEFYDVIPYFVNAYNEFKERKFEPYGKPETFEDFKEFVIRESKYQFWSRCQYEIVVTGFPISEPSIKMDVHNQIMANLDIVTEIVMNEISK